MNRIESIAVFCGSKKGTDPAYADAARRLGLLAAERGVHLVYGGGGIGLMEVVAEAALSAGGRVTGVIPDFMIEHEVGKANLTEIVVVPSMHDRKRRMFELADGFVVLPGGIGTLDEAIEIISWKQLQLHAKPISFLDVGGYWAPFVELIKNTVVQGFAHKAVVDLFSVVEGVDVLFEALENAPLPGREVLTSHF